MSRPLHEKEKLLTMLTEIYDQLEELELVLEGSFTEHRMNLNSEELNKISVPEQRLSMMEKELKDLNLVEEIAETNHCQVKRAMKLEMGF
ncbi:MAG: hypothetical protein K0Q87_3063 [Neobacillus sp.]|jgi:hypothetical protein|nr:hypothetical protein [Neobacillus sp.]